MTVEAPKDCRWQTHHPNAMIVAGPRPNYNAARIQKGVGHDLELFTAQSHVLAPSVTETFEAVADFLGQQ